MGKKSCNGASFLARRPKKSFDQALQTRAALACALVAAAAVAAPGGGLARETVAFPQAYRPGMIVIKQSERRLYLVTGPGAAIRYPVAIGRAGRAWRGETYIQGKYVRPSWAAPSVVRADHPQLRGVIPGGSARNPMGAAALMLGLDEVAIHGTSEAMRGSVGSAASYGCIRMYNEDVVDLYGRVQVGTPVVAIP
jgi:lipoprotein-anchoring transpeptidase ErfK/SrfK